jgi:hypothetical protein
MSTINSIYIPRISIGHDEKSIRDIMYQSQIGEVSYIDFTPINKKPGFVEIYEEQYMSAFVHFSNPWLKTNAYFWDKITDDKPYKLQVRKSEYWLCLKNKNPVQRTMMNIHQVVDNGRHLEKLIEEQAKKIEEQSKKIEELEEKFQGTYAVVYQLIGGLFSQKDQKGILQMHIDVLDGNETNINFHDENKWKTWPTTRQGDDCEGRLKDLEEKFINLSNDLTDYGVL